MTIDRAALVDAVSDTFSGPHGELAAKLLAKLPPAETVGLLEAGRVVAATLAELPEDFAFDAMERMGVVGADLTLANGSHEYVDAASLSACPDVAPYVAWTAGDQMAMAITAAFPDPSPDPSAPQLTGFAAVQIENELHGFVADLRYPISGAHAALYFGNAPAQSDRRTIREASGGFLSRIGVHLSQNGADPFAMPGVKPVPLSAGSSGAVH